MPSLRPNALARAPRRILCLLRQVGAAVAIMAVGAALVLAQPVGTNGAAAALREQYAALRTDLEHSPFGRPLHLESTQTADTLKGDIVAVLGQPFENVRSALRDVRQWCDVLVLHPNMSGCRLVPANGGARSLLVDIGRQRTPAKFTFHLTADQADYLHVKLDADKGPLGTTDYRVDLEAVPLDPQRSILHLVYSHGYGLQARIAMRAYLSTLGRDKVGFTVVDRTADGRPVYVGDLRGALERNAMRYYLCIVAYLETLSGPPQERFERRLQTWYDYAEQWPRQLREDGDYLARKRAMAQDVPSPSDDAPGAPARR